MVLTQSTNMGIQANSCSADFCQLLFHLGPGSIGIEDFQLAGEFAGFGPQVLLQHLPMVADQQGHDPGLAVLGREGHQGKAGDHVAVDHIIIPAAGRRGSPAGSGPGSNTRGKVRGASPAREILGHPGTEGALLSARYSGVPVEAVLLSGGTDNPLGELPHAAVIPDLAGICTLGDQVIPAEGDGVGARWRRCAGSRSPRAPPPSGSAIRPRPGPGGSETARLPDRSPGPPGPPCLSCKSATFGRPDIAAPGSHGRPPCPS